MKKILILAAALVLTVAVGVSAVSDGVLGPLYDAGASLLFETSNVTVVGGAEFSLDGQRFKTVNFQYLQDGYDSLLDYRLFTPDDEGEDMESGYTIVSNYTDDPEGGYASIAVMEVVTPGLYSTGSDEKCDTLVRRSAQMDQLASLAGIVVRRAEPLLGRDAVTAEVSESGETDVHIQLAEGDISDLMNSAFNLCVQAAVPRVVKPVDFDTLPWHVFYGMGTITEEILYLTHDYHLEGMDVKASLDADGRLTFISGSLRIGFDVIEAKGHQYPMALMPDQAHRIDVSFEMVVTDEGGTRVALFDPDEYGVSPAL